MKDAADEPAKPTEEAKQDDTTDEKEPVEPVGTPED